jgi:pimeloyl-ACP methyl ester carboxylesterase
MAGYVTVNGVRTWYDERGAGDPLVLLHGGLGDARVFDGNLAALADRFQVLLPERRGHGHTPDVAGPLSLDLMADDTIAFLDKLADGPVRLAGYSAGAIVAILVALRRPDLVGRLVLVSAAFHRDGWILAPSADAELPPALVEMYGQVSPDGVAHLPVVLAKVAQSATEEPELTVAELSGITCRTLVMAGDDDLVTMEHTLALYRGLPASELAVVPGTSHTLLLEKPLLCTTIITDFLTTGAPATMVPIRRQARQVSGAPPL